MQHIIDAIAREKHTIDDLISMRHDVLNMHVIDVSDLKERDRMKDLCDYLIDKGVEPERKRQGYIITIGEVHIHIVSTRYPDWEERVRGFKDFVA